MALESFDSIHRSIAIEICNVHCVHINRLEGDVVVVVGGGGVATNKRIYLFLG